MYIIHTHVHTEALKQINQTINKSMKQEHTHKSRLYDVLRNLLDAPEVHVLRFKDCNDNNDNDNAKIHVIITTTANNDNDNCHDANNINNDDDNACKHIILLIMIITIMIMIKDRFQQPRPGGYMDMQTLLVITLVII